MSGVAALAVLTHAVVAQRHKKTHYRHALCLQHFSQVLGGPLVSQFRGEALKAVRAMVEHTAGTDALPLPPAGRHCQRPTPQAKHFCTTAPILPSCRP